MLNIRNNTTLNIYLDRIHQFSYECLLLVLDICMSNLAEGAYNKFNYSIYNIQWLLDKFINQNINRY